MFNFGSKKWEFSEAGNWLVFYGLGTFSPPAWGWSDLPIVGTSKIPVLPTRVGMVRLDYDCRSQPVSSPHPRGDGPTTVLLLHRVPKFSPPAWGWSDRPRAQIAPQSVLPTRVGMVRNNLPELS